MASRLCSAYARAERKDGLKGKIGDGGSFRAEVRRCLNVRVVQDRKMEMLRPWIWGDLRGLFWLAWNKREGLVWTLGLREGATWSGGFEG